MMESIEESGWRLIRNNNGEWISDRNAVLLSKFEIDILKISCSVKSQSK